MKLILIRGLPGTGKTTLARRLTIKRRWHYEADFYFYKGWNGRGPYEFDASKLTEAHLWCQKRIKEHMIMKTPMLVVANTFSTRWELGHYAELAKAYQYDTSVIKMVGCHGNIHDVPQETIDKMAERWEEWPTELTLEGCGK